MAVFVYFIRDGVVWLLGSDVKVLIRILRDTGAHDSYIVDSVLPFSSESDTGDRVLSRRVGLSVLSVPLHKLVLDCDLIKGEVVVGVRLPLPIEGVQFILGNALARSRLWADTPPLPVVTPCPAASEITGMLPDVSCTCVVTRAMAKLNLDQ